MHVYAMFAINLLASGAVGFVLWDVSDDIQAKFVQTENALAENKGLVQGLSNQIGLIKDDIDRNLKKVSEELLGVQSNLTSQNKKIGNLEQEVGIQVSQLEVQKKNLEVQQNKINELAQKDALEQANIEAAKKSIVVVSYTVKEIDGSIVQTFSGICSGVIYKQSGQNIQVVTNQHCIDWNYLGWSYFDPNEVGQPEIQSETIEVSTLNGVKHTVTQVQKAVDGIDLALITFQKSESESFAMTKMDASLPKVGDDVVAIGSPSGLAYTTTKGIVSASRQISYVTGGKIADLVQTDAAINPGNSGGGLFRLSDGALLGINTFGISDTEGLNFAISTKTLVEVLP